ncbi:methionine adenosyltransferase [Acidimicrobiia bacterium]|nr:methionine adenosyltransferase [Acidimicrobiia bacterium]MDC1071436.1 methionine adenosyltransferase [Acidimicrobiia bacterium]
MNNLITAETVSPGHPDKIADLISDYVLTQALTNNDASKVAVETFLTGTKNGGLVLVGGEISEIANISSDDIKEIVKLALSKTIKTSFEDFDLEKLSIYNELTPQSEEIRAAVEDDKNQGAGDQGIMVGYATNKTKSFMPVTFDKSRNIQKSLWDLQNSDPMLDLDSKVQVTSGGEKTKVVFSTQHKLDIDLEKLKEQVIEIISQHITEDFVLDLNPSGSFVKGGPAGDTGLTGRKIVVDAYGPSIPVGGGAFSGKDPSKVDRSAAYAARHLAKNIVAHGLSDRCQVRVAYAIGKADPYELSVETFGTEKKDNNILEGFIEKFDMRPAAIIERLALLTVDYRVDTLFSHFGHDERNWEKIENI